MRKIIVVVLAVLIICTGCSAGANNDLPVNGYENSGNSYLEWFVLTDTDFINDFQTKLEESEYPELTKTDRESDEFIDYTDADTKGTDYPISLIIHKDDHYIRMVESEFSIKDEYTAEKAGFYFSTLIKMFTPQNSDKIIDALHIFESFDDGVAFYTIEEGNTIYTFSGEDLSIKPIEYDEEQMVPVTP